MIVPVVVNPQFPAARAVEHSSGSLACAVAAMLTMSVATKIITIVPVERSRLMTLLFCQTSREILATVRLFVLPPLIAGIASKKPQASPKNLNQRTGVDHLGSVSGGRSLPWKGPPDCRRRTRTPTSLPWTRP